MKLILLKTKFMTKTTKNKKLGGLKMWILVKHLDQNYN